MVYHKELVATSSIFIVSLYTLHANDVYVPSLFQDLIFLQGYVSMVFWWNPVKGSLVHNIDKVLARISVSSIIAYKLCYCPTPLFVAQVATMLMFFKLSNTSSLQSWCSRNHIMFHALAHICAHRAIYLAFL